MKRLTAALSLLVFLGAELARAAPTPLRSDSGVQMVPTGSWQGQSGVGGFYYKTGSGFWVRNPDNTEVGPLVIGAGSGSVTSVGTGNGLQGGPITASGTIDLRLNVSSGLIKTLGGGSNELGIDFTRADTWTGLNTWTQIGTFNSTLSIHGFSVDPGATTPTSGQALAWNGSAFVPTTITTGVSSVTAGSSAVSVAPNTGAVLVDLPAIGSAGSCGDASHSCSLSFNGTGGETARANVAIVLPLTSGVSGVLPIANGGTNSSTALSGNSVMQSNGSAIVQGPTGSSTQVYHGNLAWGAVVLTADVSGVLPVGNGGTGATTLSGANILNGVPSATGDLPYSTSGTPGMSFLLDVATGNALISGGVGAAPAYGKIGLTTHVSGVLPIANGGTNSTATPTAGGLGYGTGSAHAYTGAGSSGQVAISQGASAPSFSPHLGVGGTANEVTTDYTVAIAPAAISGGLTALHVQPGADTALTTDDAGFWLDYTGVTLTCTHGSCPSLLRAARITQPTYTTSSGSDTVPMAASLSVGAMPTASGGLTITTPLAIRVGNGNVLFGDLDATTGAVTNASYLGLDIKPTYGFHQLGNGQRAQAIGAPTGVSITNSGANNSTRQDYVLWPRDAAGNAGAPVYVTQIVGATVPNNSVNFTLPAGAKTLDVYLQYDSTGRSAGSVCTGLTASPCSDTNNSTSAFTLPLLNLSAKSTNDSAIAIGQTSDPTNTLTMAQGSMFIQSLATPAAATYAFTGTNNGKQNGYYYYCFTGDGQQNGIASASAATTSTGSTQLSTANYWTVTIAPPAGSGYCTLVRYLAGSTDSAGSASTGVIATKIPATTTSFRDTGIVATAVPDQTTIEPVIFITEPTAASATITQQAAGGLLWKSPAWASTAAASRDNYGYLGFRGLTGSTTTGEFVLAFEVNNTPGSAQVFADAFRFDQGGYIRSPSTGNQLAMMNSSLGGTGGFLLLSGTHVFIGDSGSTILQTISTALEPLADDGAMNLGALAVRFRNAFFSRGIMVAPASTTQLAAGHFQAGGIVAKTLTAATISSIGQNGAAGSTSYTYVLATVDLFGNKVWSAPVTSALGNATLSSSNNNQINVTVGSAGSNGITYNLYRIASAGSGGGAQIGLVASGQTVASVNDIGNAATGSQTTGALHNATADTTFDSLSTMGYVVIAPVAQTQNLAQYSVANFTVSNPQQAFKLTSAAHTGLLASTEFTDVLFDLSASVQFNTGALTTQEAMVIKAPTYTAVGASTFTNMATVSIDNAPTAGTNVTGTNKMAFWVKAGAVNFGETAVSQATNVNTNVTANGASVVITTQTATTAANAAETGFTLSNTAILAGASINCFVTDYSGTFHTNGQPDCTADTIAGGSAKVHIVNRDGTNALNGTMKLHIQSF